MSYIIPPPIKIEFPEQVALSDSIGGSRSDVAASELAVKLLADQMRALGMTNLLINPRGKINQANESDGVIAAGDYFCDGWKAGANGAEVYRLADGGFDLRSGSIVQLVPNDLEASRLVRTNLDVIAGSPVMKVNGAAEKAAAGAGAYIEIEVSGDNSKFNRLVAAASTAKPIYQQLADELSPCLRFYFEVKQKRIDGSCYSSGYCNIDIADFPIEMHDVPACVLQVHGGTYANGYTEINTRINAGKKWVTAIIRNIHMASGENSYVIVSLVADSRP